MREMHTRGGGHCHSLLTLTALRDIASLANVPLEELKLHAAHHKWNPRQLKQKLFSEVISISLKSWININVTETDGLM